MFLALTNNFGAKSSHSALSKEFIIVLSNINFLTNLIELFDRNFACRLKTVGNLKWMETFIKQLLGLIKNSTSKYYDTCCAITDFIILGC